MINRLFEGFFKGVAHHFQGYFAKSYDDVLANARKQFNPQEVEAEELAKVQAFRDKLNENENYSKEDIDRIVKGKEAFLHSNMFISNAVDAFSYAHSLVGGTVAYGTKKAASLVFTKQGRGEVVEGTKTLLNSNTGKAGAATAVAPSTLEAAKVTTEAVGNAAEAVASTGVVVPGIGHSVADAIPSIKEGVSYVTQRIQSHALKVNRSPVADKIRTKVSDVVEPIPLQAALMRKQLPISAKETVSYIGNDIKNGVVGVGSDIASVGKTAWHHRDNKIAQAGILAGGALTVSTAFEAGQREGKHKSKMAAVINSNQYSSDGGGTFLRDNFGPSGVDNHGANGDLVFALRNLRHGG